MFRKPPEDAGAHVAVEVEGRMVRVPVGASAAAAALMAGVPNTRTSPADGSERGPYCLMGVCFECLMVIDGVPSQQGCMVTVREGMRIERQRGPRPL